MTIRFHIHRGDGFGEYRNFFEIENLAEFADKYLLKQRNHPIEITISKNAIIGKPEIVD